MAEKIDSAQRRSQLSSVKRSLLEKLLQKGDTAGGAGSITRRESDSPMPLSYAQQRLWFLAQLEPGKPLYNISRKFFIRGPLNASVLEQSLNEIIRRHEILRTTFAQKDGSPVQIIHPFHPVSLSVIDLTSYEEGEREAEVQRLTASLARSPIDLECGPLFKTLLLRLSEEEHVLGLTLHHIVCDGWSLGLLYAELSALYSAFTRGLPSPLPPLPVQYADYARWQRGPDAARAHDEALRYWGRRLAGAPPALELPADRPRPAARGLAGATLRAGLPGGLARRLSELARGEGVTPFMVLLAGFAALLSRYSGQTEVVVGSPVADRPRPELEGLIGFFVNTLALRLDASGAPSFRGLLSRVREACLEAYAHQAAPFERVVEAVGAERGLSHSPLFQVMFAYQNASSREISLPGLETRSAPVENGTTVFDLTLYCEDRGGELDLTVQYSTELFDDSTAARLLKHYQRLLDSAVADPGQRISQISLLSEAERRRMLSAAAGPRLSFPREACVHQRVARQAAESLGLPALLSPQLQLSYQSLNSRASALARHLCRLGVRTEDRVGVLMSASPRMVVAMLAALKAGAAYVPIDVRYPAERIRWVLADAGARLVLSEQPWASASALPEGLPVISVDEHWESLCAEDAGADETPLGVGVGAENAAYIIYTSGSTGQPKGVKVTHRGLVNLMTWHRQQYDVGAGSRATQVAGVSFDASVWELWPYLAAGASVSFPDERLRGDAAGLIRWLAEEEITHCFLPTPLAEAALQEPWPQGLKLRWLLTGGDRLRRRPRAGLGFTLVNHYGPTETTVVATAGAVQDEGGDERAPTIGRAIANTEVYVLDEEMQVVDAGVVGEVYVGGEGLAQCYWNRPGLTAERFVPHPHSQTPGARLYRTGDRALYLPDGELEYVGRSDQQVKIRGYRIEPGEIEAALNQHPLVRDCVVAVRQDEGTEPRLVAYVVADAGEEAGGQVWIGELRQFLKERLPEYMVPAAFVQLAELPLTPNGKIDRKALPVPEGAGERAGYVAPRTEVEEALARIWSGLLRVERVGAGDNFFDLGGHSLLATQVVSRLRTVFGVELPLGALFANPTVESLAREIARARGEGGTVRGAPIARARHDAPLPLSFGQRRLWLWEQMNPGTSAYNVPGALHLAGRLDAESLVRALEEVVRRHEVLRTSFESKGAEPVQVVGAESALEVARVDLTPLAPEEREREARRLAAEEAEKTFDLTRAPLLRAALLRLGEEKHVLLLTLHHIVSDGWSFPILLRELFALYGAYTRGEESPLSPLPVQYADYAQWQRSADAAGAHDEALRYWGRRLAGAPPALELPTDRPRPPAGHAGGVVRSLLLPDPLLERLKLLCRDEQATPFMVLLAGFAALLSRYSGQTEVVVGSPVADRPRPELEGLIGFFVNTLALRLDASGAPSFRGLLSRVREACLEAYAHQAAPFERVVEAVGAERGLSHSPLFQVMFALQNVPREQVSLEGLAVGVEMMEELDAKFELTLAVSESSGGLSGGLQYNKDLFDEATAARMLSHYRNLLRAVIENPEQPLDRLELLSERERCQLLLDWNLTRRDFPRDVCVHELFEAQAERVPGHVALVLGRDALTYAELNRRANQVAHYLRRLGVGPDAPVAVCAERSLEMIVAMLGVLKAGGAYVPLDPSSPAERLSFMLNDTGARVLLTHHHLLARLPQSTAHVLLLDADRAAFEGESTENLAGRARADNLAYVIYTSGSTGWPKGVEVQHAGLVNLVAWHRESFCVTDVSRATQAAGQAFDASLWEVWPYLAAGASLYLLDNQIVLSAADLWQHLVDRGITHCFLPTPLAEAFLPVAVSAAEEDANGGAALRYLLVGGDKLHRGEFNDLPFNLVNCYGPTEYTVVTTSAFVGENVPAGVDPPIGRPIDNTQIYVCDSQMRPVPVGVVGELYIGGVGLARGYLNRPGLTAERFLPNPFGAEAGARCYRTGDLVRFLADGQIEFLGRVDQQVKVRGFRVELGEIESAVLRHPRVREAVVVQRPHPNGNKYLVAYLVADGGPELSADELRSLLKEQLPGYMIPSAFVLLKALPLTPNGKVDRQALPEPDWAHDDMKRPFEQPRTWKELRVAREWESLLGVERVGRHDNFFDLGGNSLLMMQYIAFANKESDISFPVAVFYSDPTVAGVAEAIRKMQKSPLLEAGMGLSHAGRAGRRYAHLISLQPEGSKPPFFFVHPVGGHLGETMELAQELAAYDQPVYGLQAKGLDDDSEPHARIEAAATAYIEEILSVQPRGLFRVGGYCSGGLFALEIAQQLNTMGAEVELLALIGSQLLPDDNVTLDKARRDAEVFAAVSFGGELKVVLSTNDFLDLSPDERREKVWEEFCRQTPEAARRLGKTVFQRMYKVYRANLSMVVNYRPSFYNGRVALFEFAFDHKFFNLVSMWERVCRGTLQHIETPGHHLTAMRQPHVKAMARLLNDCLEDSRAAESEADVAVRSE